MTATSKQLDSVTTVTNELEEKEQVYQTAINNVEKEMNLRQQAAELHRKKAAEQAQCFSQLRVTLGRYHDYEYVSVYCSNLRFFCRKISLGSRGSAANNF